jgi:hypothetical protein
LRAALAASATTRPSRAHTIHDGKYDPRILRDGEPLHPAIVPISENAKPMAASPRAAAVL